MAVKPEEIATLIELFNSSDWDELHVEIDGLQLFLSTDPHARLMSGTMAQAPQPVVSAPVTAAAPVPVAAAPAVAPQAPASAAAEVPLNWVAVTAPNLGTFYRATKPGAAPLIEVGQHVTPTTEVCLLEVMKLFTTVCAGVSGTVRRVCVADSEMVEHDQVLFWIEP